MAGMAAFDWADPFRLDDQHRAKIVTSLRRPEWEDAGRPTELTITIPDRG